MYSKAGEYMEVSYWRAVEPKGTLAQLGEGSRTPADLCTWPLFTKGGMHEVSHVNPVWLMVFVLALREFVYIVCGSYREG